MAKSKPSQTIADILAPLRHKAEDDNEDVARLRRRLQDMSLSASTVDLLCEDATSLVKKGWAVNGISLARYVENYPPFARVPDVDYEEAVRVAHSLGEEHLCDAGPMPPSPFDVFKK